MKLFKQSLYFLIIIHGLVHGQKAINDSPGRTSERFIYPVVFYTPETRWAYGVSMMIISRDTAATRSSSWLPLLIYTQNRQVLASVKTDLYGKKEKWQTSGWIGYYLYPDQFYGIGNRTKDTQKEGYTANRIIFQFSPKIQIQKGIFTGIQYEFMDQRLSDLDKDGALITGNIPGSSSGRYSGIGNLLIFDTRDNIFSPLKGVYHKLQFTFFDKIFGSDYQFRRVQLDMRQYFSLTQNQVLAFQLQSQMIFGIAPFQTLSAFGGSQRMRGYYEGRFRDNHMLIAQTEYRFFLNDLFGAAVFGGVGDVAHHLNGFHRNGLKYSAGFGFRINFSPDEKLNLRIDFGYGKKSSGIYIEIGEAF